MKRKNKEPLIQDVAPHKGRRKHNPTLCIDKKRGYFSCGICGSENLVQCGVLFCDKCGSEKPFVTEAHWFHRESLDCECDKIKGLWYYHRSHSVKICVDCDAVKGPLCPNCKHPCWAKGNRRFCHFCGYRRD